MYTRAFADGLRSKIDEKRILEENQIRVPSPLLRQDTYYAGKYLRSFPGGGGGDKYCRNGNLKHPPPPPLINSTEKNPETFTGNVFSRRYLYTGESVSLILSSTSSRYVFRAVLPRSTTFARNINLHERFSRILFVSITFARAISSQRVPKMFFAPEFSPNFVSHAKSNGFP